MKTFKTERIELGKVLAAVGREQWAVSLRSEPGELLVLWGPMIFAQLMPGPNGKPRVWWKIHGPYAAHEIVDVMALVAPHEPAIAEQLRENRKGRAS